MVAAIMGGRHEPFDSDSSPLTHDLYRRPWKATSPEPQSHWEALGRRRDCSV